MPLLLADHLHLHFGPKKIFEGDSLAIEPRDRVGVVGPNGAGKSTLLKILAGSVQPDGGKVVRAKGLRVGYLDQEHGQTDDEPPLLESLLRTAPGKGQLEGAIQEAEKSLQQAEHEAEEMAQAERLSELHIALSELHERFGVHRAAAILSGLGFSQHQFELPVRQFSGGWRMRAALGALLYQQPDVLLLDEPTNHLDLPSVQWLSGFLKSVSHAVVLTCHDRSFLNRHVERVASLELEGIKTFRGNYDDYLEQRAIELAHLEARQQKDAERKKQLEAFVTRFKAKASKARQAQSRAKMIERLEEAQLDLPTLRRPMRIQFEPLQRTPDRVLKIDNLSFGYDQTLLSDVCLEVRRKERVSVVGVNGAGKTTLLRLLAGELSQQEGHIEYARGVQFSYFAQHHADALSLERTILEEVWSALPHASQTRIRAICGSVLFTGDDVDKPVRVLSGGEKARVALAKMLVKPAQVLLMDEPTNHLDTESADVLTASLEAFEGTLIFVSHNLDFAERLGTQVWDVSRGKVTCYDGSVAEYLSQTEAAVQETFATGGLERELTTVVPERQDKAARKAAREEKKRAEAVHRKEVKRLKSAVSGFEADIARLEEEKTSLEGKLSSPEASQEAMASASRRLAQVLSQLESTMDRWAEAQESLEALQAGRGSD